MHKRQPTQEMVIQIIVEEMMQWETADNEDQRKGQMYDMANRLIRYFALFDALPETLPGLPGGAPLK